MSSLIKGIMGLHRSGGPASRFRQSEPLVNPFGEEGDEFAHRWYGARDAGEALRQWATRMLNTHPPAGVYSVGGMYPDPRVPSGWGPQKTLVQAAHGLDVKILEPLSPIGAKTPTEVEIADNTLATPPGGPKRKRWAWLNIDSRRAQRIILYIRPSEPDDGPVGNDIYLQVAMTIGHLYEDWDYFTGPYVEAGRYAPPTDDGRTIAVLHQFAIGLLGWARDCPDEWHCQCNRLRNTFSAVPPDHAVPTGSLRPDVQNMLDFHEKVSPLRPRITNTWTNPNLGDKRRNTGA